MFSAKKELPVLIVGISGKRGAGKSTMADYLVRKYGFTKVSFGAKLKDMAKLFFPFDSTDFTEKAKERPYKTYDWSPRDFMIALGKFARYHDEDYWVKASGIDRMVGNIVIDDVRFPNEVKYLRSIPNTKIVRLNRFEKLNIYGKNLDDPSETSLDDYNKFDYVIEDCWNVSRDDLYSCTDRMLKELRDGHSAA